MGKPRSVFNNAVDTNRKISKQFGQLRQNILGMSSTFRGMPANVPLVSGGETRKIGGTDDKFNRVYTSSLRIDPDNRIDLNTTTGIVLNFGTTSSHRVEFQHDGTQIMLIQDTQIDVRKKIVTSALSIDIGSSGSEFNELFITDISMTGNFNTDVSLGGNALIFSTGGSGDNKIDNAGNTVLFFSNGSEHFRYASSLIQLADAIDIKVDTTTGTKIGTSSTQKLGFWGVTPVVQRSAYTVSNHVTDRSYDANSTSVAELADVLGTLLVDLKSIGIVQ